MKKAILLLGILSLGLSSSGQEIKSFPEGNYTIKNISGNTKYQDYGVSYSGDSTVIFASSRKTKTIRNKTWAGNDQPYLNLYKGIIKADGEITNIELFSKKINTKFHDADLTYTKDFKTIYFTRNNYLDDKFKKDTLGRNLNQLYRATLNDKGGWEVYQMPFNNDNYQTGQPALNNDETKLYFISDMLGGFGKTDIYEVDILNDGTYSEPRNLGPEVNTSGKEMFPFVDEHNVLYFSSDGYIDGLGGLDIYTTKLDNNTGLVNKKSENIGSPLNSAQDDFGFVRQIGTNLGYFSSNRPGGKGDDDIYSFVAQDCNQSIEGIVLERDTEKLLPGALVALFDYQGVKIDSVIANENAAFSFSVDCQASYKVAASKQDYVIDSKELTTSLKNDLKLNLILSLAPNEFVETTGVLMVNINPIYFDLDKSNIREDAAIEIQKVVTIMKKYPRINIDLSSYTDSRATNEYNMKLSERRAISSRKWMIDNGIAPERISAKGYGETKLVNECSNGVKCTKEQHQLNRRTEFLIVNPEVIKAE